MEFSTQTSASLHQIKTAALAVGVFTDGMLSNAADIIDHASNGAIREVLKSEFQAKPNSHLVLRNLPGVAAVRVILVGLGKQDSYNAKIHAGAEQVFATYCAQARLTEGVSALASIDQGGTTLRGRAQACAIAAGQAVYRYDATFGKVDRDAQPKLKKITVWVARN